MGTRQGVRSSLGSQATVSDRQAPVRGARQAAGDSRARGRRRKSIREQCGREGETVMDWGWGAGWRM